MRGQVWTVAVTLGLVAMPAQAGELESRVLAELNLARTSPQTYAARLRDYRGWFSGRIVEVPGERVPLITEEGVRAVDEAIRFLDRQAPLGPLKADPVLAAAARDWVAAQGPRGAMGHRGADGRGPGDRVRARGGDRYVAENISYGLDAADLVVLQLIVDDGVPDRGHRKIIYDGSYAFAGTACGAHAAYRHMCVIDYATYPAGTWQRQAAAGMQAASAAGGRGIKKGAPESTHRAPQ